MKKALLPAIISALFATSVSAVPVYDADGLQVDVFGDLEVRLQKETADGSDLVMETNDSDYGIQVVQAATDDVSVFGKIQFDDEAERKVAIVGLSNNLGTASIGVDYTVFDDIGFFNDYVFGITNAVVDGGAWAEQVAKVTFVQGNVYGAVAYALNEVNAEDDDQSILDGKIGMIIDDLDVVLFANSVDDGDETATSFLIEATYSMDALGFGVTASTSDYDDVTTTAFGGQVTYTMDKLTYSAAAGMSDAEGAEKLVEYFAGVEYQVSDLATVYAQVGGNDVDDSELGYATGLKVAF